MEVDWRAIRALNGDRAQGFEELCSPLARYEAPAGRGRAQGQSGRGCGVLRDA